MELTASGVRFLLSPAALNALTSLLGLPHFQEGTVVGEDEKQAGIAWLQDQGYLFQAQDAKPVLAKELAFMITGLCTAKSALLWSEREKVSLIGCCFEGIYLLCWRMRVGKWALTPYDTAEAFRGEMESRLSLLKEPRVIYRAGAEVIDGQLSAGQVMQLLQTGKEE